MTSFDKSSIHKKVTKKCKIQFEIFLIPGLFNIERVKYKNTHKILKKKNTKIITKV